MAQNLSLLFYDYNVHGLLKEKGVIIMTMRRTKRYTVQSLKKKEYVDDPYAMPQTPKGVLECPECHAIYYRKRWVLPELSPVDKKSRSERKANTARKAVIVPHFFVCPACQKIRDGYAEGFLYINWGNWLAHKADVLNLIHNEEQRACQDNPLERVMNIRERTDGVDLETTTEHLAQRIGKHLQQAFRGKIQYKWSHKDKLARVEWKGPKKRKKASSK